MTRLIAALALVASPLAHAGSSFPLHRAAGALVGVRSAKVIQVYSRMPRVHPANHGPLGGTFAEVEFSLNCGETLGPITVGSFERNRGEFHVTLNPMAIAPRNHMACVMAPLPIRTEVLLAPFAMDARRTTVVVGAFQGLENRPVALPNEPVALQLTEGQVVGVAPLAPRCPQGAVCETVSYLQLAIPYSCAGAPGPVTMNSRYNPTTRKLDVLVTAYDIVTRTSLVALCNRQNFQRVTLPLGMGFLTSDSVNVKFARELADVRGFARL